MIRGFVDAGRPFMPVLVSVPRLGLTSLITFLVDTGADNTIVHPLDASHLGVRFPADFLDSPVVLSQGIGGDSELYTEACILYLSHVDRVLELLPAPIRFAPPSLRDAILPSILGRDVIGRYRLTFEQASGLVTLDAVG